MKCPDCEEEIEELRYEESLVEVGDVTLDENEALKWEAQLGAGHSLDMKYLCPHCESELDLDDDGAIKFLKELKERG